MCGGGVKLQLWGPLILTCGRPLKKQRIPDCASKKWKLGVPLKKWKVGVQNAETGCKLASCKIEKFQVVDEGGPTRSTLWFRKGE